MRTTSIKTIYLNETELKQAITQYLKREYKDLALHLDGNSCEMTWSQEGDEFIVSVDGEVSDAGLNEEVEVFGESDGYENPYEHPENPKINDIVEEIVDHLTLRANKAANRIKKEAFKKISEQNLPSFETLLKSSEKLRKIALRH